MMITQKKVVCINAQTEQFDHSPAAQSIDSVLAQHGFEVIHTPWQERGVSTVSQETPDVVLLDMGDNQHWVWDLYHQIRQSSYTHNIPVILITSKATCIEDVLQLYAANAAGCLVKPFAPQELLISINQALLN